MCTTAKKGLIVLAGGQTGVDQAAHRAALEHLILCAGWCPPGRVGETGPIPEVFPLMPTPDDRSSAAPDITRSQRTEWNVRDADGTLILGPGGAPEDPGTAWAAQVAKKLGRPLLRVAPADESSLTAVREWLTCHQIRVLNIAGPSERTSPGISDAAHAFLSRLFDGILENDKVVHDG